MMFLAIIFASRSIDWPATAGRFLFVLAVVVAINSVRIWSHNRKERERVQKDADAWIANQEQLLRAQRERQRRQQDSSSQSPPSQRAHYRKSPDPESDELPSRPPWDIEWRRHIAAACWELLRTNYQLEDGALDDILPFITAAGDADPAFKQSFLERQRIALRENEAEGVRSLTIAMNVEDPQLRMLNLMAELYVQFTVIQAIRDTTDVT